MKKNRPVLFESRYSGETPVALQEYLKVQAKISGRSLRKYFFKGFIEVNQRKAHSAATVKPGDAVRVYRLEESTAALTPEAAPITIVFENNDLLILNKPALLPVHPSGSITSGTLSNRVAYYFQQRNYELKIRPVNRLDNGTSGLIIFAKSASCQAELTAAIQNHTISRIYYAVVQGIPVKPEGLIDLPILDHPRGRRIAPEGKPATTRYQVLQSFKDTSLLELSLLTGRTHQIRIHLSHIGHPILGDRTYGTPSNLIKRPALHAGKLIFSGPQFAIPELTAPLPDDMLDLIHHLKSQAEEYMR